MARGSRPLSLSAPTDIVVVVSELPCFASESDEDAELIESESLRRAWGGRGGRAGLPLMGKLEEKLDEYVSVIRCAPWWLCVGARSIGSLACNRITSELSQFVRRSSYPSQQIKDDKSRRYSLISIQHQPVQKKACWFVRI